MQHKEVASCYHRLGLSYYWDNQYELSIKSYKQALEIREYLFGKESKAFDDLRFSLGQACYYANMAMEAKEYFLASVGFRKSEYGSSSKEYKKAKEWLDKI
jgi:tetratricopeptide (TPR) repeat protein